LDINRGFDEKKELIIYWNGITGLEPLPILILPNCSAAEICELLISIGSSKKKILRFPVGKIP